MAEPIQNRRPSDLLTTQQMSLADRLAVEAGVPSLTLMENAGRAVADEAVKMVAAGARIHVFCGPGNNGGDGFVAARLLAERGYKVTLGLLGQRSALKGDAGGMAARWTGEVRDAYDFEAGKIDLYIDALFGAGLSRPLDEAIGLEMLSRIGSNDAVLSVDVPSGLDGNTGQAVGPVFQATRTVTFFRLKPGHLLMPGRAYCGDVVLADIGIPEKVLSTLQHSSPEGPPLACVNDLYRWRGHLPVPEPSGHKYSRGHAVVVSGGPENSGAARLGARAALRVGAGLVTVAGTAAATMINAAQLTAVMVKSVAGRQGLAELLSDKRLNAVLIGPGAGVGPETADAVLTILATGAGVVLDADALTSFAASGRAAGADSDQGGGSFGFLGKSSAASHTPADLFTGVAKRSAPVVMTPHMGEFGRVFPELKGTPSKLEQARAAAKLSGAVIILKGPDTVIAAPDGQAAINDNAPAWLATAGSGDVLAGLVTGLLAQQMPAFKASCAAVWLHGAAATAFGPGLIAEDLPEMLPRVLVDLLRISP